MKNKMNISVIIPMYNAERYIRKCLDSIISQTYQNLEVIIVNDGSTDSSREICEEYVLKDKRITLVNTENRGAGSARNTGLEMATGDYVSFIDSDDYICSDYYERLSKMIQETNADIAIGRYKRISEHDTMKFVNTGDMKERSSREQLLELYGEDIDRYVNSVLVTNKLFNKKLFGNEIRYPIRRLIDDEFIIYKLIDRASKIVYTDDVMYAYVQSDGSVMRTNFKEKRVHDTMDVYDEVYAYFKEKDDKELNRLVMIRYLLYCVEMAQKTSMSEIIENKKKVYEYLKEKFEAKSEESKEKIGQERYEKFYGEFYEIVDK